MNLEHYRHRLLSEQHEASSRLERAIASAREASARLPHDSADEGAVAALKDQQFAQADAARQLLDQVRGALDRIENGTFGLCAEDGEPFDEARLEAVPWAAFCHKHDRRLRSTS